jgi:hypothetical protein
LAALAHEPQLRYLLIGGHAVIAHGYPRTTFDIDLLVHKEQSALWVTYLAALGYQIKRQEGAFTQFIPPPGDMDLDLMLVNHATFEGLWQASQVVTLQDQTAKIPSLDHLLALKLHVLKQKLPHRVMKDLDDVIQLVLVNQVDIQTEHYRALFERYGSMDDYAKVIHATRKD